MPLFCTGEFFLQALNMGLKISNLGLQFTNALVFGAHAGLARLHRDLRSTTPTTAASIRVVANAVTTGPTENFKLNNDLSVHRLSMAVLDGHINGGEGRHGLGFRPDLRVGLLILSKPGIGGGRMLGLHRRAPGGLAILNSGVQGAKAGDLGGRELSQVGADIFL